MAAGAAGCVAGSSITGQCCDRRQQLRRVPAGLQNVAPVAACCNTCGWVRCSCCSTSTLCIMKASASLPAADNNQWVYCANRHHQRPAPLNDGSSTGGHVCCGWRQQWRLALLQVAAAVRGCCACRQQWRRDLLRAFADGGSRLPLPKLTAGVADLIAADSSSQWQPGVLSTL